MNRTIQGPFGRTALQVIRHLATDGAKELRDGFSFTITTKRETPHAPGYLHAVIALSKEEARSLAEEIIRTLAREEVTSLFHPENHP